MLAHRSVSSWWVPASISAFTASAGFHGCCSDAALYLGGGFDLNPRLAGGALRRPCSTLLRARSARMLTLLMTSSRRLCWCGAVRCEQGGCWRRTDSEGDCWGKTYDRRIAKVLRQKLGVGHGDVDVGGLFSQRDWGASLRGRGSWVAGRGSWSDFDTCGGRARRATRLPKVNIWRGAFWCARKPMSTAAA